LQWAISNKLLTATAQWKLKETFAQWEREKPTRSQVASFIDWLAAEVTPTTK
jgi:hypothetical protein